jgi:hypothetical protein
MDLRTTMEPSAKFKRSGIATSQCRITPILIGTTPTALARRISPRHEQPRVTLVAWTGHKMSELSPTRSQTATVKARQKWNRVGLLRGGVQYLVDIAPDQHWYDWTIRSGPEGYERWYLVPLRWMRRMRSAPWFALVGTIGQGPLIRIADKQTISSDEDAELRCFANDIGFMYWNNRGAIRVTLTPIAP